MDRGCRRWRSNPSGQCSQERLTQGTVTSTMRRAAHPSGCARCGAGADCSAIKYQSLSMDRAGARRQYAEAGLSVPRRVSRSRDGPVGPEAGLSVPRRACSSRGGPIYPVGSEAGRAFTYATQNRVRVQRNLAHKKPPYRRPMLRVLGGS